jgi:hypothetical protein
LSEKWDKIGGQFDELGVVPELFYPAFVTEYRGGERVREPLELYYLRFFFRNEMGHKKYI